MNRLHAILCVLAALLVPVLAAPARGADLDEIHTRGELRHLGIRYAHFVTGTGDGFDVELMQGFARSIGVRYQLVYSDFYSVMRDLLGADVVRDGAGYRLEGRHPVKGDVIAAGFTVLPWREKFVLFSEPTFPSQVLLVARADSSHRPVAGNEGLARDIERTKAVLGTRSLLVMERTCLDPANYGLKGKGIDLRAYTRSTNLNEMVPALLAGEAEFTLLDVPDAVLDLRKWSGRIKVIGPISEHQRLAAAFPPDAPALRDAFDAYLRRLRADGSYDRLVRKYWPAIETYFPEFFAKRP